MKYLYTTEPDEGCHKINGVYGRPVHTSEQAELRKAGWVDNINQLKEDDHGLRKDEEEGREESQEVSENMDFDGYLRLKYEEIIGKKPHHKMKRETMQEKIAEAEANDNNPV